MSAASAAPPPTNNRWAMAPTPRATAQPPRSAARRPNGRLQAPTPPTAAAARIQCKWQSRPPTPAARRRTHHAATARRCRHEPPAASATASSPARLCHDLQSAAPPPTRRGAAHQLRCRVPAVPALPGSDWLGHEPQNAGAPPRGCAPPQGGSLRHTPTPVIATHRRPKTMRARPRRQTGAAHHRRHRWALALPLAAAVLRLMLGRTPPPHQWGGAPRRRR